MKRREESPGHTLWQAPPASLDFPALFSVVALTALPLGDEVEVRVPMKSHSHYELWFPL